MKKILIACTMAILVLSGCGSKSENKGATSKESDQTSVDSSKKDGKSSKKESSKSSKASDEMFSPNPDSEDEEVFYESDKEGKISASTPDYSQYTKEDVIKILGEPGSVVTDPKEIVERLNEKEWDRIKEENSKGNLTESQAKAFLFASSDLGIAAAISQDIEALIYEDQDKPNVYLSNGKVSFITPMTDYIDFNGKIK